MVIDYNGNEDSRCYSSVKKKDIVYVSDGDFYNTSYIRTKAVTNAQKIITKNLLDNTSVVCVEILCEYPNRERRWHRFKIKE